MSTIQISFRYANSLFRLAQKEGSLEEVYAGISDLARIYKKVTVLSDFVHNPLLSEEERNIILSHTFAGKLHPLVLKFVLFVSIKNRLSFFEQILGSFEKLYMISKNRIPANIITALDVSEQQKQNILTQLNKKHGLEVVPSWEVNPEILGGFKIFIEGKLYDSSLSSQLEEYRQKVLN